MRSLSQLCQFDYELVKPLPTPKQFHYQEYGHPYVKIYNKKRSHISLRNNNNSPLPSVGQYQVSYNVLDKHKKVPQILQNNPKRNSLQSIDFQLYSPKQEVQTINFEKQLGRDQLYKTNKWVPQLGQVDFTSPKQKQRSYPTEPRPLPTEMPLSIQQLNKLSLEKYINKINIQRLPYLQ
ncbi:hypothetical protein pb186bvf_002190 [Paramecium bursaria]